MRLLIAEDEVLLRQGLARLLEEAGFEIAGEAGDAGDLLRKANALKPDVALVDIRMPPTHTTEGLDAAEILRERHPEMGVLLLSHHTEPGYAMQLLERRAGGIGYLLKDRVADVEMLVDAINRVAGGGSVVDKAVVAGLVGRRRVDDPLAELTERERELLGLMAEGRSNTAIAEQLVLSERTVEGHVRSIFLKLGLMPEPDAHRRVLAVLTYLRAT